VERYRRDRHVVQLGALDTSKRMSASFTSGQFAESMAKVFGDPAMLQGILSVLEPGSVGAGGSGSSAGPEVAALTDGCIPQGCATGRDRARTAT